MLPWHHGLDVGPVVGLAVGCLGVGRAPFAQKGRRAAEVARNKHRVGAVAVVVEVVDLPSDLGCRKVLLNAGLSSQALLLGRRQVTYEALYISRGLQKNMPDLLDGKLVQAEMSFQEIAL